MKKIANLQDLFLLSARRERVSVTVFLVNGFQMRGVVTGFDSFVVMLESDGKQQMLQTWQHILDALCSVLRHDVKVRPDAFTEQFTPEQFAGILFSLMLSAVVQQSFDPSAVLEIVRRTIY